MTGLLNELTQIALLRKDPSGLPSSTPSVVLIVFLYAVVTVVMLRLGSNYLVLPRTAVDVAFSLAFIGGLLALTGRLHRFPQTVIAAFGAYVLLAPVRISLLLVSSPATAGAAPILKAVFVLVIIWYLLIIGHVLRTALDTALVTGFALAVAWMFAGFGLSQSIFGAPS